MSLYTRKGDDGTTGRLGEGRIPKYDDRLEAIGALDESSAALGVARSAVQDPNRKEIVLALQRDLYRLMAEVAASPENAGEFHFDSGRVEWLEQQTDGLSQVLGMPKEFIVPGDSMAGAALALARAIVRRAERRVAHLADQRLIVNPALQRYLNRLSSLLFVLELTENQVAGTTTTLAKE